MAVNYRLDRKWILKLCPSAIKGVSQWPNGVAVRLACLSGVFHQLEFRFTCRLLLSFDSSWTLQLKLNTITFNKGATSGSVVTCIERLITRQKNKPPNLRVFFCDMMCLVRRIKSVLMIIVYKVVDSEPLVTFWPFLQT